MAKNKIKLYGMEDAKEEKDFSNVDDLNDTVDRIGEDPAAVTDENGMQYVITPKGLMYLAIGEDPAEILLIALKTYMQKFYSWQGVPAIILDKDGELKFTSVLRK